MDPALPPSLKLRRPNTASPAKPRRSRVTSEFYRIINEVPTVLMIGIVILVIVKPFS